MNLKELFLFGYFQFNPIHDHANFFRMFLVDYQQPNNTKDFFTDLSLKQMDLVKRPYYHHGWQSSTVL